MIKCEKGEVKISGLWIEFISEFLCIAKEIAQITKETESEEMITFFKSELSDAIALGFGEKTLEECFNMNKE